MITAFASNKGGVGKSTAVCQLAAVYARRNERVVILDTDKNGTSGNWIEYRSALKDVPRIAFVAAEPGERILQMVLDLDRMYDRVLIDLQGGDNGNNRLLLTLPHIIVFPFTVSQPDLDTLPPILKMVSALKVLNTKASFHYLINNAPTTTAFEEKEAWKWFRGHGVEPIQTVVHSRKVFRDSMSEGYGIIEMQNGKACEEILGVISEIDVQNEETRMHCNVLQ